MSTEQAPTDQASTDQASTEPILQPTSTQESDEVPLSVPVRRGIHFDPGYITTVPGMVKTTQAIISLIGFISAQTIRKKKFLSAGGWYTFVSLPGFCISTLFVLFYVFHVVERYKRLPWLVVEMTYAAVWFVLFFIASTVAATRVRADPPWGAAAFFGFVAMVVFAVEAFMKWRIWNKDQLAQGTRSNVDVRAETENESTDP